MVSNSFNQQEILQERSAIYNLFSFHSSYLLDLNSSIYATSNDTQHLQLLHNIMYIKWYLIYIYVCTYMLQLMCIIKWYVY